VREQLRSQLRLVVFGYVRKKLFAVNDNSVNIGGADDLTCTVNRFNCECHVSPSPGNGCL